VIFNCLTVEPDDGNVIAIGFGQASPSFLTEVVSQAVGAPASEKALRIFLASRSILSSEPAYSNLARFHSEFLAPTSRLTQPGIGETRTMHPRWHGLILTHL